MRLATLRQDQRTLIDTIQTHKKAIELALEQLKAVNIVVAEVADEIEEQDFEEAIHHEREEREEIIESIDGLVQNTQQQLRAQNVQNEYLSITAQHLSNASKPQTLSRLYKLAEQPDSWDENQAAEFFNIENSVRTSMQYKLTEGMQQTVQDTYKAIKTVRNVRGQDIEENYLRPAEIKVPNNTMVRRPADNIQQYQQSKEK